MIISMLLIHIELYYQSFAVSDSTTAKSAASGSASDHYSSDSSGLLMNYYRAGLSGTSQSVLNMLGVNHNIKTI